ncbi:putative Transmembrane protein [Quillaja saponaria]|uniref:Transmembrane protein n=1 Tax=Quillaja saponaria TaxID=32244 RepID=A0AAD7KQH2_QUISA|nr:putative Transmembrane protein [Quillaja saponaria]
MKALFSNGFSLFFFIIFLLVILSSISALPTSGSTKDDPLKFILGEDNMGPWKNGISQSALAPGPASDVSESTLVLASNRTRRPDILNGFRRYQGGWDISNRHYWASVGFTGVAGFIIAVLWFVSFGLAIAVHFWCGWRIKIDGKGSNRSQKICLALLMFFTCAAVTGCIVLSVGQDEFHGEVLHTLKYVVNQSDYTVQTLRNVTEYLSVAKTVNVAQVFLPSDVMNDIDKLNVDLNTAANTLTEKTTENSIKVKRVFNAVRSALIVVAVVMLLLALIGLVLSILGHQHAILILIISGWLLVAITFILCGLFVILNSAISDTCMAMGEWVENPQAESALSNILPCVDQGTTNKTLIQSKQIISNIVNVVNQFIYNYANANPPQGSPYYCNQSGPSVPPLCYPFDSQLNDTQQCGDQEVSFKNASLVWHKFRCEVSASGLCTTVGRLTPDIYSQLVAAVNESYALEHYVPPILSLQDCNFVRDTFLEITSSHCPSLEHYLKIVNAGLTLISVGVLLCLVLWVIYANRPQREEAFAKLSLSIKLSRSWKDKFNNNRMNDTSSTALNGV